MSALAALALVGLAAAWRPPAEPRAATPSATPTEATA